jgi:hypothetical protein
MAGAWKTSGSTIDRVQQRRRSSAERNTTRDSDFRSFDLWCPSDEAVGYSYPEAYVRYFGEDYQPPDYLRQAYDRARRHKWYMTSRLITVNDPYIFDPHTAIDIDDFEDVIGRHFRQPKEGLGFDNSPVAHMWRTMIWPRNSL